LENIEQSSQEVFPPTSPQLPPTLFREISFFIQRMPAWLFALLSLAVVFFLYQIVGGLATFLLFGTNVTETNVDAVRWATMFAQFLFLLIPTVVLAKLRFPAAKNFFRFGRVKILEIFLVLIAVFTLQQLLQGYLMLQETVPVSLPPVVQDLVDQVKEMMEQMYRMLTSAHSIPEFLFVVLVIAATPAVCEELLFRGLIQRTLEASDSDVSGSKKSQRGLAAAIVAGIIFGMYHLNPFTLVPLAVLGVFFGIIVYRTQNIVTAMAAHFFNNFLACLAVYLELEDDFLAIAPTEPVTPEMLAANVAVSAVVFVAATYYLVRITKRLPDGSKT
jgi:membrane protease YdiL (CAAX protease family)